MLNITAKSQTELLVVWSKDNSNSAPKKFEVCWKKVKETEKCLRQQYSNPTPNVTLFRLRPATKYEVTVARYDDDRTTLGKKVHKIAITRSG